jgi:hypothetical protein
MVVSRARRWIQRVRKDLSELWQDALLLWSYRWEQFQEILYRRTLPVTQFLFSRFACARIHSMHADLNRGPERGGGEREIPPRPASKPCMHAPQHPDLPVQEAHASHRQRPGRPS